MIRIDVPDIVLANDIENRNSEAILLNAQLNIDIIQNKVGFCVCILCVRVCLYFNLCVVYMSLCVFIYIL